MLSHFAWVWVHRHDVLKGLKWRVSDRGDLKVRGSKSGDPKMSPEDEEIVGGECNQSYAVGEASKKLYEAVRACVGRAYAKQKAPSTLRTHTLNERTFFARLCANQ